MKYDLKQNTYTLSSGRRIYANGGYLGINEDLSVHEGYDGTVIDFYSQEYLTEIGFEKEPLTASEQDEICDFMIDLWTKRKATPIK